MFEKKAMRNFIILSILLSGILLSCNQRSKEKLITHIDTLSYLSEVLNDSIGVKFASNQVMSYNIYMEKNDYGKSLYHQLNDLSAKNLILSREILSLQRKFGSNSSECLLKKYERELTEETKNKLENDLKSPNAYTGLINQISLMVVGEDSHKYSLTFDKDLNLIGFVKN
jgi:hypothetical protein